jgi:hypothetical protein
VNSNIPALKIGILWMGPKSQNFDFPKDDITVPIKFDSFTEIVSVNETADVGSQLNSGALSGGPKAKYLFSRNLFYRHTDLIFVRYSVSNVSTKQQPDFILEVT